MMPGIFCLALQPRLNNPDEAFLKMLTTYMPVGMMGLMIAVLFAASVAGVAGGLNAFSTIFTMDIYQRKLRPASSDRHLKRVSQLSIIAVSIAAVGVALLLQGSRKNIFDTLQGIICYFAPPMAAVFLLSLIWKRATATAVHTTLYVGTTVCLTVGVLSLREILPKSPWTHFMMLTFLLFLFCTTLLIVVSLCTEHSASEEPLSAAKTGAAATAAGHGAGRTGWILWGVLAVVMIGLYGGFQSLSWRRQKAEIYLSPSGDDANPGNGGKPFRTIARARTEISHMKSNGTLPDGGLKIWLHGGAYRSATPMALGTEDSGVSGKPLLWVAFPGESPVIDGN